MNYTPDATAFLENSNQQPEKQKQAIQYPNSQKNAQKTFCFS